MDILNREANYVDTTKNKLNRVYIKDKYSSFYELKL